MIWKSFSIVALVIGGEYPKTEWSLSRLPPFSAPCSFLSEHTGQYRVCKLLFFSTSQGTAKLISLLFEKQLCFSQNKKKNRNLSVEGGLFWAVVMTTIEACVIFSFWTAIVLPVFSQPSSSLWSEQSSSPSHLHDKRTQRPVPQRNWSAVHMDVAAGHAKRTLVVHS